tara:strand:+ start:932 stop:1546 length:615 start_codon:yes stop_codon:yes gene_type:complete
VSKIKELPQFTSLTDMANQFATEDDKAGIFVRHSAQYAVSKGVTSDKVSDEQKAELSDGFRLRFNSNNPVKQYRKEGDDVYVPMEKGDTGIGIDVAMSYTTHAFGQLKGTRPNFHGIIKAWRDGFSTYSSQKLGRLIAAIKAIENENAGVTKTRAPNAEFTVYVAKALDGIKTRNKNARSKGDTTALSDAQINKAVDAFKMALL